MPTGYWGPTNMIALRELTLLNTGLAGKAQWWIRFSQMTRAS